MTAEALQNFHFLRPLWLLALVPVLVLAWWSLRTRAGAGIWRGTIDPALLEVLLLPQSGRNSRAPLMLLATGWCVAVLALAGPAWERLPEPVHRREDALIIALDLSLSMHAADIAPSRLERARFKLADLLARRREGLAALVVYAGDAHVVTPLSDDSQTLASMLPALTPEIMPAPGSNLVAAVQRAGELLAGAGIARGRLLVVADAFPAEQAQEVAQLLERHGLELSLLAVGTLQGAPVQLPDGGFARNRDGSIVVPGMDARGMRAAVERCAGRFSELALDDSDLRSLLPEATVIEASSETDTRLFDRWRDTAPWLALALLPIAALALRRGWLLALPLALLLPPPQAHALGWEDVWLTPDQQGARALAGKDPARAAQLFRDPQWRGSAAYEAGDYAGAAEAFSGADSATAHYNRGNSLARAGRLEDALEAYDAALAQEPELADVRENRALVEELLKQQQQQQQEQQKQQEQKDAQQSQKPGQGQSGNKNAGDSGNTEPGASPGSANEQGEDQQGSPADAPGSGNSGKDGPAPEAAQQGMAQDEAAEGQPDKKESAAAAARAGNAQDGERAQALEQWLRQVPDDPGALLRRKFEYEYRQRRGYEEDSGDNQ